MENGFRFENECRRCKCPLFENSTFAFVLNGSSRYNGLGASTKKHTPEYVPQEEREQPLHVFCGSKCLLDHLDDHVFTPLDDATLSDHADHDMCDFCKQPAGGCLLVILTDTGSILFASDFCSMNCLRTAMSCFHMKAAMQVADTALMDEKNASVVH